jgi:hypothetical protein
MPHARPVQEYDLKTFRLKLEPYQGAARYDAFRALWESWCHGDVLQTCREAVNVLAVLCPEVTPTRGQVVMLDPPDGDTRPWPHWWAVAPDGSIVDPTASQFPSDLEYRPLDEAKGEPTGRCPNCGGLCHGHRYLCSDTCEIEFAACLNGGR